MKFEQIIEGFVVKELPESEVEIVGEVPFETVAEYREKALADIAEQIELPGFRAGHVPAALALQKVGEMAVLEEALELCLRDLYPEMIVTKNIDVVGRPDIRITKLAPGNPTAITIRTAVYPKISLPEEWREIAKNVPKETAGEVTDAEITETIEALRKQRAHKHEDGTEHLPEVDDAFAQSIGALRDVAHLKEEIGKGIAQGKERESKDKRRSAIIEAIIAKTKMDIPRVFVEAELEKIIARMKDDVVQMGATFDDYLQHIKKTEEELRGEFRDQAEKRAKLQLALNELADKEQVVPDETAVETEMTEALKHFPNADRGLLRTHIETVLRNDAVLKKLEGAE